MKLLIRAIILVIYNRLLLALRGNRRLLLRIDGKLHIAGHNGNNLNYWCALDWRDQALKLKPDLKTYRVGWPNNWQCGYVDTKE